MRILSIYIYIYRGRTLGFTTAIDSNGIVGLVMWMEQVIDKVCTKAVSRHKCIRNPSSFNGPSDHPLLVQELLEWRKTLHPVLLNSKIRWQEPLIQIINYI